MTILAVVFLVFALAVIAAGVLAWTGRLPGNAVVGLRIPEVRRSPALWEIAHKVAGPLWTIGGVVFVLGSMVTFTARGWLWIIPAIALAGGLILIGVGAAMGANAVALIDSKMDIDGTAQPAPGGCCGGAGGATGPQVNLEAVRKAAQSTDSGTAAGT
ncbi:SdpI family protein [Corynebacterium mendelii]|uniref:SdpI family protein n=1 Tax=Corynebacterium mendelii TaxID=2765362 RepID=A0A939E003_9CORY|nr:SdpI family protein [Corynebacterium mendelii]MBN9644394.1 SdpI family protein [Corynebacterium mendelii]